MLWGHRQMIGEKGIAAAASPPILPEISSYHTGRMTKANVHIELDTPKAALLGVNFKRVLTQ